MSNFSAMKQTGARNLGYKIGLMEWSDKMDLIAISNEKGEVIIYRLNWQKIWTHPAPHENVAVRALAWRPDEKIIAIGYSSGDIMIIHVENKEEIYSYSLGSDITSMSWTTNTKEVNQSFDKTKRNLLNSHLSFLPTLPNLNSLSSTPRKTDYTSSQSCSKYILNFLIVCSEKGTVHLSVFGMLPCGITDIFQHFVQTPDTDLKILCAKLTTDFKHLNVVILANDQVKLLIFENDILWQYTESLLNLAIIHYYIINTLTYINDTIQSIVEAWETVLMEMDNKLTKYAESQDDGAVSADFLELLMFGHPSTDLEQFLTRELTEKGLKKLGNCIELSYSTIQKLVVKYLHSAILHICYYLNCIKGMSKNVYYYEDILGEMPIDLIKSAGSFLIKTSELQQTIDQSTRDYKIFFRWLYVAIIRLMDETVPEDIATVTQQEINYLAEFLNNFDKGQCEITSNTRRFNLERVGQYLEDKNLQNPIEINVKDHWTQFLNENVCLLTSDYIYQHNRNLSLVQEHNILKKNINDFFKNPERIIGSHFKLRVVVDCINQKPDPIVNHFTTHLNLESSGISLFAILESSTTLVLIEIYPSRTIKSVRLQFKSAQYFENKLSQFGELTFRHIQFYNNSILSILLDSTSNGKRLSYFVQFPLSSVQELFIESTTTATTGEQPYDLIDIIKQSRIINMCDVLDPMWVRLIDNLDAHRISVSGDRKVASILSESCRRARFYEMEIDDDDDDFSQNNSSLDNSKDSTL